MTQGSTASFSDVPAGPSHPEFAHLQYAGGDDFLPSNSCSVDLSVFAPAVPTLSNVSAAPASPTSEDISFTGTGIERYVSYGTTKAMANVIETSNPGSPVVLRGLSPGTLYYYQLGAVSFASGCTPVITSSPMGTFTTEQ